MWRNREGAERARRVQLVCMLTGDDPVERINDRVGWRGRTSGWFSELAHSMGSFTAGRWPSVTGRKGTWCGRYSR